MTITKLITIVSVDDDLSVVTIVLDDEGGVVIVVLDCTGDEGPNVVVDNIGISWVIGGVYCVDKSCVTGLDDNC